jgi:hypothetical protein
MNLTIYMYKQYFDWNDNIVCPLILLQKMKTAL